MRCLALFASAALAPGWLGAQEPPGRDLLDFPVATMAEPAALVRSLAGGLWNPAVEAAPGSRVRASLAALHTPVEQTVSAYALGTSVALPHALTLSLSALRASVGDIVRTTDNPNTGQGSEVPYRTSLVSAGISRTWRGVTAGAAARLRSGRADVSSDHAVSVDVGLAIDDVARLPLRIGASTFLLGPGERTSVQAAAEYTFRSDSVIDLRGSYAFSGTESNGLEHYVAGSARYGRVEGRAGVVHVNRHYHSDQRLRLGIGLHYARYHVGIAREENGAGLGPTYQFALTSSYR